MMPKKPFDHEETYRGHYVFVKEFTNGAESYVFAHNGITDKPFILHRCYDVNKETTIYMAKKFINNRVDNERLILRMFVDGIRVKRGLTF